MLKDGRDVLRRLLAAVVLAVQAILAGVLQLDGECPTLRADALVAALSVLFVHNWTDDSVTLAA